MKDSFTLVMKTLCTKKDYMPKGHNSVYILLLLHMLQQIPEENSAIGIQVLALQQFNEQLECIAKQK